MPIRHKRIIDGKTYNTETSTLIHEYFVDQDDFGSGFYQECLFQTRSGYFFRYYNQFGNEEHLNYEEIHPISLDEARKWLKENAPANPSIIENLFRRAYDVDLKEIKYTLRMPESLRDRLSVLADANDQSLNAWIIKCLERCAAQGGPSEQASNSRIKTGDKPDR